MSAIQVSNPQHMSPNEYIVATAPVKCFWNLICTTVYGFNLSSDEAVVERKSYINVKHPVG